MGSELDAAGMETPDQIYDKLDDGSPPQESHQGEAEPEANRTHNQMKAFERVFGRAPLSAADWTTAAALDPYSYNGKNAGVPPNIVVGRIEKVPGQGVVRTNLFIPGDEVIAPSSTVYDMNVGDNRGFSPTAGPEDTRVALVVDYDNGIVIARQNPSVNADTGEVRTGTPSIGAVQQGDGSVLIDYNAADPFSPGGEEIAKGAQISVNGRIGIEPTVDGPRVGGDVTNFPALEIYPDRPGMATQSLLQSWPSFSDGQLGPINGLLFHKNVGDYGIVTGFNDVFPQMPPPPMPLPGADPPVLQPMPLVTVLEPAWLTDLAPVNAPPVVRIDDPLLILPQPPLR